MAWNACAPQRGRRSQAHARGRMHPPLYQHICLEGVGEAAAIAAGGGEALSPEALRLALFPGDTT